MASRDTWSNAPTASTQRTVARGSSSVAARNARARASVPALVLRPFVPLQSGRRGGRGRGRGGRAANAQAAPAVASPAPTPAQGDGHAPQSEAPALTTAAQHRASAAEAGLLAGLASLDADRRG